MTQEITYQGVEMTVTYEHSEAVHYPNFMSNGDYGHEDEPEEFIIESIEIGDVECAELLEHHWGAIEEQIINN